MPCSHPDHFLYLIEGVRDIIEPMTKGEEISAVTASLVLTFSQSVGPDFMLEQDFTIKRHIPQFQDTFFLIGVQSSDNGFQIDGATIGQDADCMESVFEIMFWCPL